MWIEFDKYIEYKKFKFKIICTTKKISSTKFNLAETLLQISFPLKLTIITCEQVHSKDIYFFRCNESIYKNKITIKEDYKFLNFESVDGVFTDNLAFAVCIFTADCVPLFVLSEDYNIFGLIHIGRKGLIDGIVENMIKVLKEFNLEKFYFVFGPHICGECYNLKESLKSQFKYGYDDINNKLSLQKEISGKLESLGINKNNLILTDYCTFHNNDLFYSYRRKEYDYRIVSMIFLNTNLVSL